MDERRLDYHIHELVLVLLLIIVVMVMIGIFILVSFGKIIPALILFLFEIAIASQAVATTYDGLNRRFWKNRGTPLMEKRNALEELDWE